MVMQDADVVSQSGGNAPTTTTTTTTPATATISTTATTAAPIGVTVQHVSPMDDTDEPDWDYEEDFASDTTSLKSEITSYRFENGRRYHSYREGEYWGPNDEKQNEQLDIAHHMFTLLLDGKLLLAPIDNNVQKVLDVGTGTGIWAIDFADEFPSAEVIGTDLSPIQPQFIPPNVRFEIDDVSDTWTFPQDFFDLIHVRALYGALSDWPAFYATVLRHLKPGGWFDQLEMSIQFRSHDGSVTDDHVLAVWSKIFIDAGERFGKTFRIADLAKGYLEDAGFTNVVETRYELPIGSWSSSPHLRKLGKWNLLHCEEGIEGWAMALLTRVMGWSYEEVQVFLAQMRKGLRDPETHAYFDVYVKAQIFQLALLLIGRMDVTVSVFMAKKPQLSGSRIITSVLDMSSLIIHHNEDIYPEPKKFDPSRWRGQSAVVRKAEHNLVAFGKGSSQCVGMPILRIVHYPW